MFRKSLSILYFLCVVHQSLSKPSPSNEVVEGRGIGSTLWGWITYPFTWWRYSDPETPITEQLIGSTTYGPNDIREVGKHNVTIWCNDQTCTTMKCDVLACRNITCNIYDTDLNGECREYNTMKPEESPIPPATKKPFEIKVTDATEAVSPTTSVITTQIDNNAAKDERPLELEAALSSTIQASPEIPTGDVAIGKPHNKI